ncbi:MAG: hypothetical protein U5K84_06570 [Alkalibacterium sp.]|nr:hypothetical protein [Alkalibacterium sp.]
MTDIDGFFKKQINSRPLGRKILKDASQIIFLSEANRKTLLSEYIKEDKVDYEKNPKSSPTGSMTSGSEMNTIRKNWHQKNLWTSSMSAR